MAEAQADLAQSDEALHAALSEGDLKDLVRAGLRWERARAIAAVAEAAAAKVDAARSDRNRIYLTAFIIALFAVVVAASLSMRVPATTVIAQVNATSAALHLDGDWEAKNLFDARSVQFTQASLLSSTVAPATTYPDGASIEISGPVRITQLLIYHHTQTLLLKTNSGLSFRLQYPRGWMGEQSRRKSRLASVIVTVGTKPATLKVVSDVEQKPVELPAGARVAVMIGGTTQDGATVDLSHPSAWDAFVPTRDVKFVDEGLQTSIVGGTLKIPSVDRSINLRRRDRVAIGNDTAIADCLEPYRPLPHCALINYGDGALSLSLKYVGSHIALGAGGGDTNVVPTLFEWAIKNAPVATTVTALFGILLGAVLWVRASRFLLGK
ncbi:hypothetical protein [Bradyrhizobium japonicum]|uniref:hypothetical protein n=1 Tax=Bradyrhizobium japonicum TaxID=375 RepID=UPI000483840E|nr:hypothetical protein [Bradyrhizobium japonicum]MCS3986853.1 hypothetical protein [Bradyrhizobium japonicum]